MESIPVTPSPVEQEVRRLRGLQKSGQYAEALAGAQTLLGDLPENRDLLLIAAASQRFLSRLPEALELLERLERLQPRFSLMHQERGLCHVALKDAPRAIDALLRAVNINPALPMSWRMLEGVYRISGDTQHAATAAAHIATLAHLPPGGGGRDVVLFSRRRAGAGGADDPCLSAAARQSSRKPVMRLLASDRGWRVTCWMMRNCCWRPY